MIITGSSKSRQKGFTLLELMVTVAIIGILSTIAYPIYSKYVTKARRAEAKAALMEIMQAQQRNYTSNSAYVADLTKLGYKTAAEVPSESEHYKITATACGTDIASCVKLTAVPEREDEECANLVYQSNGIKSHTGTSTDVKCW